MAVDVADFYVKYGPMVFRRCKYILRDEEKAKDAMQEVFVLLLNHQERLSGDYPSSLLYRMATNYCLNLIRSQKRKKEELNNDLLETIACMEDEDDKRDVNEVLERVFSGEKESTRVIAMLHWVYDTYINLIFERLFYLF